MNPLMLLGTAAALIVGAVTGYQFGADDTDANFAARGMGAGQQMQRQIADDQPDALDFVSVRPELAVLPVEELTEAETEDLLFMREEEKLARDVYQTLGEQWQLPIFFNIAQSEQTHTEAIRDLLLKYDLKDPVTDDTIGAFTNSDLQALYTDLVVQGSASVEAALRVGALIEDLDINDLEDAMERTDNADIALVYENLQRGSRNHLRSFTSQLERYGETYEPTYIDDASYTDIVSSDRETGTGTGAGGGQNTMRGWGGGRNR